MGEGLGVALFALGILVAVCLHEAGHMGTAKAFGMKVTRYFVGFGPTLFSFRRGETEYGVKAIPLGGFVKIVGMTPQDDDVEPGDEKRAMWRFPVWQRTIVMAAGSVTHFVLCLVVLWLLLVVVGVPDYDRIDAGPARIRAVSECVRPTMDVDRATGTTPSCRPGSDPTSPAAQAGLRRGDVITAINGQPTPTYGDMRRAVWELGDSDATITFARDGTTRTVNVRVYAVERVKEGVTGKSAAELTADDIERAGLLGVVGEAPLKRVGPVAGVGDSVELMGRMVALIGKSVTKIPGKMENLVRSIAGAERDPETPVSVVGASRIGGELFSLRDWTGFLYLFAVLNLFFGIFNLLPLLPMDGGHIAIIWYERVRSWLAARRGRPDPGRVDYAKLTPITLAVISVLGVFVLLTVTADVVNPIRLTR